MIYFNPLSMHPIINESSVFISLKNTLIFLQSIDEKFLLCMPSNGPDLSLIGGSSFKSLIQRISDYELKSLLTTILTDSTKYIGQYPQEYIEQSTSNSMPAFETYISYEPKYNIILSMHTHEAWMNKQITLSKHGEISNHLNTPKTIYENINEAVQDWTLLIKHILINKERCANPLPYSEVLRKILPPFIFTHYEKSLKNPSEKINTIRTMANFIAEVNGYVYSREVSSRNRSNGSIRDIFYHNDLNYYISTDLLHGRFELLDNSGIHICEIDFWGNTTKNKDHTGRHNINLS